MDINFPAFDRVVTDEPFYYRIEVPGEDPSTQVSLEITDGNATETRDVPRLQTGNGQTIYAGTIRELNLDADGT